MSQWDKKYAERYCLKKANEIMSRETNVAENTEKTTDTTSEDINVKIRQAKNEYLRKWRKQNPERVKAANERYWLKKAKEIMEREENNDD